MSRRLMPVPFGAETTVFAPSSVAAAGLILDIAGAFLLAAGLAGKRAGDIIRESTSYYGNNPFVLISMVRARADAQAGAVLLTLGFCGQLDGALEQPPTWARNAMMLPLAVAVVAVALVFWRFIWRPRQVRRAAGAGVLAVWVQLEAQGIQGDEWLAALESWSSTMTERRPAETVEALAARAFGKTWEKLEPYLETRSIERGAEILRSRGVKMGRLSDGLDEQS